MVAPSGIAKGLRVGYLLQLHSTHIRPLYAKIVGKCDKPVRTGWVGSGRLDIPPVPISIASFGWPCHESGGSRWGTVSSNDPSQCRLYKCFGKNRNDYTETVQNGSYPDTPPNKQRCLSKGFPGFGACIGD
ncbi:hypothetical protein AVEN_235161-1 [Araneus ventricosus]|uniref:Uncharacterized protein n=1 Tax=Araneus ventricosus TaxID=182803 RepID=A0A4Y2H471_ARAVE|nr:hypothetical protein AVEN_235161-1 [Araneus ventricosus]